MERVRDSRRSPHHHRRVLRLPVPLLHAASDISGSLSNSRISSGGGSASRVRYVSTKAGQFLRFRPFCVPGSSVLWTDSAGQAQRALPPSVLNPTKSYRISDISRRARAQVSFPVSEVP